MSWAGNGWDGTAVSACGATTSFRRGGGTDGVTCGTEGVRQPEPQAGTIAMQVAAFVDGGAILRLVPG